MRIIEARVLDLEIPFGQQPLEFGVLALELSKPLHVRDLHAPKLASPPVERMLGYAMAPTDFPDCLLALLTFPQNANNLLL